MTNVIGTFADEMGHSAFGGSDFRIRTVNDAVSDHDLTDLPISDALSSYPAVAAQFAQAKRGGRPITRAPPARALKVLNPRLWHTQDWDSIAIMDQTRYDWGKEMGDGTKFEYTGVGIPFKPQPLLRKCLFGPRFQVSATEKRYHGLIK